jgi:hypothetical protein
VHEDILATVVRLDKSEALLGIEPLHSPCRHVACLSLSARSGNAPPGLKRKEGARKGQMPLIAAIRQLAPVFAIEAYGFALACIPPICEVRSGRSATKANGGGSG